jgi:ATP-binding cassette subfamily C protein
MSSPITLSALIKNFIVTHKKLFISYIVVLIIIPIRDIGISHIIGKILGSLREKNISYYYIYILFAALIIIQIGSTINEFIDIELFPVFQKYVSIKILSYVFEQSSVNLQDIFNGKILSTIAHFPKTLYNYMDSFKSTFLPQFLVFIIAFIYITLVHKYLGWIVLAIIVVYYFLAYKTMTQCNGLAEIREKNLITMNENIDDVLSNIVGILNSNSKDTELRNLAAYFDRYQELSLLTIKCTIKYKFILMPILLFSLLGFITVGYQLCMQKKLKIEGFIVSIIIYLYIFNSIIGTIDDFRDASLRDGMLKENIKIFNSMPAEPINQGPIANPSPKSYLYFDRVNYSYVTNIDNADGIQTQTQKVVLKDFTLDVKQGEKLLIIGQIGSGKTTILKLLMRYKTPMSGHIYYRGTPFENISRENIRHKIGYIPQTPILLNRTLYENIVYGAEGSQYTKPTKQNVMDMIKYLQLDHIFGEERLDQMVGKHGSKLSGGQRQVVWILRVLVQDPEILLMDEPTSAIDKETKTFIDRLFKLVMQNRTVIIVSHDEYMSKIVDRTIKLENGTYS